jgi:threonine dehydrogenase-like Zn-dependent dehydrogenase
MKTRAVRLHGKNDVRLDEFELPSICDNEMLAEVFTDSLCMSTYKAVIQGEKHKRVPEDIEENPVILGHELCGIIRKVGSKWKGKYQEGEKFVIQPNSGIENGYAPGYSYSFTGGNATYIIIPNNLIEHGSVLKYRGSTFFEGSLVEPLSCVIGAFKAQHHYKNSGSYEFIMGIKEGGSMAILGGTGPMGSLAIDLAIHGEKRPAVLLVTGRTQEKLDLVEKLYSREDARKNGVDLIYLNTSGMDQYAEKLKDYTIEKKGFDDVFVFVPDEEMVTEAEKLLGFDGCLNFFAGPTDTHFTAPINFYNVHYNAIHVVGTSGGNTEDMKEAISYIEQKKIQPAKIVTHILGLEAAVETTKNMKSIGGGKKIVYTHCDMPLTEIKKKEEDDDTEIKKELNKILEKHDGIWNEEAERYLLNNKA